MAKSKKIKLFTGLFYISAVGLFLYFIFTKFSFQEITSYEFIKNNRDYFYDLRQTNLFLLGVLFILFSILWVFAAGFGSPLALFAGFIFGKWFGLLFTVIGLSIGATLLYIFANYFLKEMIRDRFLNRFQKLEEKFQKSEFLYLLIYRFIGGIPFQIQNVLPCIFNVKVYNYFWSTFLGMIPSLFIMISIGSGLEEIINQNLNAPSVIDLITSPSIYIPLIAFFVLLIITIFFRKVFYKN
ncbi:VTT domain-containing protein [Candidatus Pelagibacter sp.]|nr:VTT domain-containing protein [Candidatus Pelagibacter sp.]